MSFTVTKRGPQIWILFVILGLLISPLFEVVAYIWEILNLHERRASSRHIITEILLYIFLISEKTTVVQINILETFLFKQD